MQVPKSLIASAKSLRVERITADAARRYLDRHHPLGGGNCTVALGVLCSGKLCGVMTLGNPIVNTAGAFADLRQHELIELRKMHLSDQCPPNSESRVLAIMAKMVRKHWPACKAIITYCDDAEKATAYKASGWLPWKANRYVRELLIGDRWYSIRNANRLGIVRQATDWKYECRRKWVLPLCEEVQRRIGRGVPLPKKAQLA